MLCMLKLLSRRFSPQGLPLTQHVFTAPFCGQQHSKPAQPEPLAAFASQPSQPPPDPSASALQQCLARVEWVEQQLANETEQRQLAVARETEQRQLAVAREREQRQQLAVALAREREQRQQEVDGLASPRLFNLASSILDLYRGHAFFEKRPSTVFKVQGKASSSAEAEAAEVTGVPLGGLDLVCSRRHELTHHTSKKDLDREVLQLQPSTLRLKTSSDLALRYASTVILSLPKLKARRPDMGKKPKAG